MKTRNLRANPSRVQKQPGGGRPAQRETETEDGSVRHQYGADGEKQRARSSNLCSIIARTNVQIVDRNRRATTTLSPILYLFQIPTSILYRKLQIVLAQEIQQPLVIETQRRPGPKDIPYGIPAEEWPTVLQRVANHESYRKIAADYGVSRETIRRLVRASKKAS